MYQTKYELAERVAYAIQQSDSPIRGISASTLTVAFMNLRLDEVRELYKANCE